MNNDIPGTGILGLEPETPTPPLGSTSPTPPPVAPVDDGTPPAPAPQGTPPAPAPELTPDPSKAKDAPPQPNQPDPDRSAQNNQHYQTQYQDVMGFLSENAPQVAEQFRNQRLGTPQVDVNQPAPQQPAPPVAPVPQSQPDAYDDLDWSDPNAVRKANEDSVRKVMAEERSRNEATAVEAKWVEESRAVGTQYAQFAAGIPQDVMARAEKAADEKLRYYTGKGVEETTLYSGGPMKALRAVVESVNEIRRTENFQMQSVQAQGKMAEDIKNNMMMNQPSPTAPPDPDSALTPQQKQLQSMQNVGNNAFSQLFEQS